MKKIEIKDGVSLYYIEENKFKTATLSLYIHRPIRKEEASKNALLPMVLKRGSAEFDTLSKIELKLQELYGAEFNVRVIKKGEDQIMCFDLQTIADQYAFEKEPVVANAAKLLLQIVFNPVLENGAFKKEYVESEKIMLSDMIDALVNDKQTYALWRCYEEMCKEEAYGIHEFGNKEEIEKIDSVGLYQHYKNVLESSRIDIFVCGRVDVESLTDEISKALKNFITENASYPASEIRGKTGEVKRVTDVFDANQAKLSLGLRTSTKPSGKEYYHLLLANSILGSGPHSKLFNNVREKLSLAYYAFSRLERSKGIMLIGMGIEETNYQKALDETLLQLDLLKKGEVSEYEYLSAKAFLINMAQSAKDSQYGLIDFYLSAIINNDNADIEEFCRNIEETSLEQAVEAAKKIELDTIYFLKGR